MSKPHVNPCARVLQFLLISGVVVLLAGCAGNGRRDPDDFRHQPLPYRVGVFFDASDSSLPEAGSPTAPVRAPRFAKGGRDVAWAIARGLSEDHGVVAAADVLDVTDRHAALEASLDAYDYLLAVGLRAPPAYTEVSRPWTTSALEIVAWVFGGLGSWFVPDTRYETDTELVLRLVDLSEAGEEGEMPSPRMYRVSSDRSSLSLWERSDITERPGDYALTIVVPPMFIRGGGYAAESAALTEDVLEDLQEGVAERLKDELVGLELERPLRVAFRSPRAGASFSGSRPRLVLDLVSRDAVPVTRVDVWRTAEGSEPARWSAPAELIERYNAALAEAPGGRAMVEVPPLPLVAGKNVVRVGVVRRDGKRVTRTAVYSFESE